jgi:DNA-binding PadR family transcriptional regulator
MKFSAENPDIKRFVEQVKTAFNDRMQENKWDSAKDVTDSDLRRSVLAALQGGAKNGHQVIDTIAAVSAGTFAPTEGQVFPVLESLVSDGLATSSVVDEKKAFAITDAGTEWLTAQAAADATRSAAEGEAGSKRNPQDTFKSKAELVKAGLKLGQAVAAIGGTESVAKHKRAAEIVENASKAVFAILAEDD